MKREQRRSLLSLTPDQREWLRLEVDQRRREAVRKQANIERAAKGRRKRKDPKAEALLRWSASLDREKAS